MKVDEWNVNKKEGWDETGFLKTHIKKLYIMARK